MALEKGVLEYLCAIILASYLSKVFLVYIIKAYIINIAIRTIQVAECVKSTRTGSMIEGIKNFDVLFSIAPRKRARKRLSSITASQFA